MVIRIQRIMLIGSKLKHQFEILQREFKLSY